MTYTADFLVHRVVGDMFQGNNGDVWKVVETYGTTVRVVEGHGLAPSTAYFLQRCKVQRIWEYNPMAYYYDGCN